MDSRLITIFEGPLLELEQKIIQNTPAIERWFRLEWQDYTPPFYLSVDLHNTGFKLAPVDSNLFPDGFHNLPEAMLPLAVQAAMAAIEKYCPDAKNILLVPQTGTQNPEDLENLARLIKLLRMVGLNLQLGYIESANSPPGKITLPDGTSLPVGPLVRSHNNRRVGLADFNPCAILLNDNLSDGTPEILQDLYEQTLLPPVHSGSTVRNKVNHFAAYDDVARRFARMIEVDPWTINPYFNRQIAVNMATNDGKERIAHSVSSVLGRIRRKYKEYRIQEKPYVEVLVPAVSNGQNLIQVADASELADIDFTIPGSASAAAGGLVDVFIQEGVRSRERMQEALAEPVVYMIDRYVVGGFYRIFNNLSGKNGANVQVSHFAPPAFSQPHALPDKLVTPGAPSPNRFYMYGVIARLALLAAAIEMERTDPEIAEF